MGKLYEKKEQTYHREELPDFEQRKEMAAYLGRWVWYLFWLVIPGLAAGFMTSSAVLGPTVWMLGTILTICVGVLYGVILLMMGKRERLYTTAGIFQIVGVAVTALDGMVGESTAVAFIYLIIVAALTVYTGYKEFYGHGTVLKNYDFAFSQKWETLWKWYLGSNLALVVSALLILVGSVVTLIGAVLALTSMIALLVIGIVKLVYLYRMAKLLRNFAAA